MKHVTLRVSEELLARLHAAAKRDHRSLHGQVLWLLERGLDETEPPDVKRRARDH